MNYLLVCIAATRTGIDLTLKSFPHCPVPFFQCSICFVCMDCMAIYSPFIFEGKKQWCITFVLEKTNNICKESGGLHPDLGSFFYYRQSGKHQGVWGDDQQGMAIGESGNRSELKVSWRNEIWVEGYMTLRGFCYRSLHSKPRRDGCPIWVEAGCLCPRMFSRPDKHMTDTHTLTFS